MASYCDPDWHDGDKVPADYMVRGQKLVPLDRSVGATDTYENDGFPARATFACCRRHLEPAVHLVLIRYSWVQVREEHP